MSFNLYRDGKVHVQKRMCETCIWKPNSPLRKRADEMHREAEAKQSAIVCHSTLDAEHQAACHGHLRNGCAVLQVAERLGFVEWT